MVFDLHSLSRFFRAQTFAYTLYNKKFLIASVFLIIY